MGVLKKAQKRTTARPKATRKKVARIKLVFDKELETLSGTILFPQKLEAANKFLSKTK